MSMHYPIATAKRSRGFLMFRSIFRCVFWTSLTLGALYLYMRYYY